LIIGMVASPTDRADLLGFHELDPVLGGQHLGQGGGGHPAGGSAANDDDLGDAFWVHGLGRVLDAS
jgi:hypothetical protein